MERPMLRVKTDQGRRYDDPSEDLLYILFEDIVAGDEAFFVVERLADGSGQTYIQVARSDTGGFIVEYRDGGPDKHYGTESDDMKLAHEVVTKWSFGLDGWKDHLRWSQLHF